MAVGETSNWRTMFLVGVLGVLSLLLMRRGVPESPRWLLTKQKHAMAEQVIEQIEFAVQNQEVILREGIGAGEGTVSAGVQQQEQRSAGDYCI